MKRYYRFAGMEFCISLLGEYDFDERNLKSFVCDETGPDAETFHFEMVDELNVPEGNLAGSMDGNRIYINEGTVIRYMGSVEKDWKHAHMRIQSKEKKHYVQLKADIYKNGFGSKTILNALGVETLLYQYDGLILHASYIEHNGKAILFTAPSETGKSTQAEFWKKLRGARIINGDRAAIRIVSTGEKRTLEACGIPFSGSSKDCINEVLPIEAIVYLGQAKSTTIVPLKGLLAFRKLWEQVTVPIWDKRAVEKTSALLEEIINNIPIYKLDCTKDESGILALESVLESIKNDDLIKKGKDI